MNKYQREYVGWIAESDQLAAEIAEDVAKLSMQSLMRAHGRASRNDVQGLIDCLGAPLVCDLVYVALNADVQNRTAEAGGDA